MIRKKKCNSKSNSFVAAAEQVCVFKLFLNTDSDEADVTSRDRPFHTFAPKHNKIKKLLFSR